VGIAQQDVPVSGQAAACVNCHRPSGLGTAEGRVRPLPVTAAALFARRTGARARPAYTADSLRQAITEGRSASGMALQAPMPKYKLGEADLQALIGYLSVLGAAPAPGVTDSEITLATLVGDDAPRAQKEAIQRVFEQFFAMKNGGSRLETRRAAAANRHLYGERRDRAYRKWRLVIWTVRGSADTWPAQLARQYDQDPPFAMLSGSTGHDWKTVHAFCEARKLPCILPLSDGPPEADADFYSLYYNSGADLEARVTAQSLVQGASISGMKVLIARNSDARSADAVHAFENQWAALGGPPAAQFVVNRGRTPSPRIWRQQINNVGAGALIAWLPADQLAGLGNSDAVPPGTPIYTADSFTDWTAEAAAAPGTSRFWHVYPYRLAGSSGAQFPREQVWLHSRGLDALDPKIAGRVLFACHALGEQLAGIENNFSREYLLEGMEHMLDNTSMTTLFPRTTLGQGQRFLSRGAFVVHPDGIRNATGESAWVQLRP
jgi:Cytochrome c